MTMTGNTQIKNGIPVSDVVNGTPTASLGEPAKLTRIETTKEEVKQEVKQEDVTKKMFVKKT